MVWSGVGLLLNFLLACAIVTCTERQVWLESPVQHVGFWPPQSPVWNVELLSRQGYTTISSEAYSPKSTSARRKPVEAWLPSWARCRRREPPPRFPDLNWRVLRECGAGWPLVAFSCSYRWANVPDAPAYTEIVDEVEGGVIIRGSRYRGEFFVLPYGPVWPGMIINTGLYAIVIWLGVRGPSVLRRIVRRKRGLCVICGYPRRGGRGACSECGAIDQPKW